jgi:hypothetical protein
MNNMGCSDDGFKYFRDWLISEGEATYTAAIESPDSIFTIKKRAFFDLELYGYSARKVYKFKTGNDIKMDFNIEVMRPQGRQWKPNELIKKFPKIAKNHLSLPVKILIQSNLWL